MSLGEASGKEGLFPSVLVVSRALSGSCLLMLLGSPEFVGRILHLGWSLGTEHPSPYPETPSGLLLGKLLP